MPLARVNGIQLSYERYGSGDPVVLVTGAGAKGRAWRPYQVPALTTAGFEAITVDNRGVPPTDSGPGPFGIDDMAADVAGLIRELGIEGCRVLGFSLGGMIVQEMLLACPDLVSQAVLMATCGRQDVLRLALTRAEWELLDSGVTVPPRYAAVVQAMQYLSPRTLNDDTQVQDWLEIFELSQDSSIGRAQRGVDLVGNRLEDYRKIGTRCLALGFRDDLMIAPHLCRELADFIPDCRYVEVADCGHFGFLERPDVVNQHIVDFFTAGR